MAFLTLDIHTPAYCFLTFVGVDSPAGSNCWRRTRLLHNHTARKIKRDSNRHVWWPPNGHGFLSCCLWRRSSYYQGSRLYQKNIPRLLWSPQEVYQALNNGYKIYLSVDREREGSSLCLYSQSSADGSHTCFSFSLFPCNFGWFVFASWARYCF